MIASSNISIIKEIRLHHNETKFMHESGTNETRTNEAKERREELKYSITVTTVTVTKSKS